MGLIHATVQMNLECIILSERSQTQKGHIFCDSIYAIYRIVKSIEVDGGPVAGEKGEWVVLPNGHRVLFGGDYSIFEVDKGSRCTAVLMY